MSNTKEVKTEKPEVAPLEGKMLTLETLKKYSGKLTIDTLKSVTGKLKNHARVVISLRLAHSIAAANHYEGTAFHATATKGQKNYKKGKDGVFVEYEAKEGDFMYTKEGHTVLTTGYANGYMNAQTKPTGGIWELDEKGDLFQGVLEAAKAANVDIVAGTFSEDVIALLDLQLSNKESGTRKRDYTQAADLWS
jgi:hypothetical protein